MRSFTNSLILFGVLSFSSLASAAAVVPDTLLSLPNIYAGHPTEWDAEGSTRFESNRAVLADSASKSGFLWSKHKNPFESWTAEFTFHVSGVEDYPPPGQQHAKDGLAFWYTANPKTDGPVKGSQDYWDGLGLFFDYDGWDDEGAGPDRGALKGHLNDGSTAYTSFLHGGLNAFSLCRINYRNSVEAIKVQVGYANGVLVVLVNGQKCFETKKVLLPVNEYYFGLSALSTGDIYSIEQFHVYNGIQDVISQYISAPAPHTGADHAAIDSHAAGAGVGTSAGTPDVQLTEIHKIKDELLASMNALASSSSFSGSGSGSDAPGVNLAPIITKLDTIESALNSRLGAIEAKIISMENSGRSTINDQKHDLNSKVDALREHLDATIARVNDHTTKLLTASLPDNAKHFKAASVSTGPSFWVVLVTFIVVQVIVSIGMNRRNRNHAKIL